MDKVEQDLEVIGSRDGSKGIIGSGENVILAPSGSDDTKPISVTLSGERRAVKGLGVFSPKRIIGKQFGDLIRVGPHKYVIRKKTLPLILASYKRCAQVISLKDSVHMVGELGIGEGSKVLEVGVGSGFMTSVLLWFTGDGKVTSIEKRRDFGDIASKNIASVELDNSWDMVIGDAKELLADKKWLKDRRIDEHHHCIVDMPDPWNIVTLLKNALKTDSGIAFYIPTYNQLERTIAELKNNDFCNIRCRELLLRDINTGRDRIRPATQMLGHTAFLLFSYV